MIIFITYLFLQNLSLPHGRIVFEVTLEGSARKLVTVRSSLILNNQLPEAVEVKLENTRIHPGGNVNQKIGECYYIEEVWLPE
jgi:hypothetical protein